LLVLLSKVRSIIFCLFFLFFSGWYKMESLCAIYNSRYQ